MPPRHKGRAVDIKQVGRELGVRYVLEGSVRKAGDRVRITGQLLDSDSGTHLWADRFDGSLADVFELQDQVTTSVVAAIAPKITQAEIGRARRKPAGSLDSYDLYLRGLALSHQFTPESLAEAVAVLRKAMEIDPSYAPAAALSLFCFSWWHSEARGQLPQANEAVRLARRMMADTTDDPDVLWMVGWCLAYLAGETEAGADLIERGVALNPNCAEAWLAKAYVNCFACRNDAAIEALQHVTRLSPLDPFGHLVKFAFALAHLQSARYQQAIEWADRALIQKPGFTNAMIVRTAACGHLERRDEAREWVGRIREIAPQLTVSSIRDFLQVSSSPRRWPTKSMASPRPAFPAIKTAELNFASRINPPRIQGAPSLWSSIAVGMFVRSLCESEATSDEHRSSFGYRRRRRGVRCCLL